MRREIGVLGGGVVGLSVAYRLAKAGREVVVCDEGEPGQGTSYGNAGTVASYGIFPVATPSLWRNMGRLFLSGESPLRVRWSRVPRMLGWYGRFLGETRRSRYERNVRAIEFLVRGCVEDWLELARDVGGEDLCNREGFMYIFDREWSKRDVLGDREMRHSFGIEDEVLSGDEVGEKEPNLRRAALGGLYIPGAMNLRDPGEMMRRLRVGCEREGVVFERVRVRGVERGEDGVKVKYEGGEYEGGEYEGGEYEGGEYEFGRVVLSMGAFSGVFARGLGDEVPLDTERGYHVEFDMEESLLSRPVCPSSRGFYMIPMEGRLRVAGTVELGGLDERMSEERLKNLERGAREWIEGLPDVSRRWLGYRPSFPDSLPVIGGSSGGSDVIYAFGHGHLGLTMAPKTALMVSDMVLGNGEREEWEVYGLGRFRR